jgi:hypothetical protein
MNPKLIGFLGFEGVAASELTRAADVLAAATLDGGYGSRISCYHICTIGLTSECFRAESGIAFWPDSTLETVSETVVSYVLTAELHFALYRQIYGEAKREKTC